jgi:hypothetical protein
MAYRDQRNTLFNLFWDHMNDELTHLPGIEKGGNKGNIVPASAQPILERTLDIVRIRANSNGECFGGEIMDALREAGAALRADRLDVSRTRTVLVRTMESMGETYPAEVLQNYENRMRISEALRYLREAIDWTARLKNSPEALPGGDNDSELRPLAIR